MSPFPQMPLNFMRSPMPGVNHLPMERERPRLFLNDLNGLPEVPSGSFSPKKDEPAMPAETNQLLKKELVTTLLLRVVAVFQPD